MSDAASSRLPRFAYEDGTFTTVTRLTGPTGGQISQALKCQPHDASITEGLVAPQRAVAICAARYGQLPLVLHDFGKTAPALSYGDRGRN